MTGLLRAEVRRITSRRLVRAFGALALLIVVLTFGKAFIDSHKGKPVATTDPQFGQMQRQCEAAKAEGNIPSDFECPTGEVFYDDPRFHTADHLNDIAHGVAGGVAVMAFVIGASYVGAEWNHGTMQALLFWEPRRLRVVAAKAVALVGVLIAATVFLEAVAYGFSFLVGTTRGTTAGMTVQIHRIAALTALRGLLIVTFTALLGFAVAGLARVTAAALGVAFGWFVILENLLRNLRPGWQRFLISENVAAVEQKHIGVPVAHARRNFDEGLVREYVLRGNRGALTLGIYLALLLGAFVWTFRRRDVT